MRSAVEGASPSFCNLTRIILKRPRGISPVKERGQGSFFPNLTAYFWRSVAKEHRQLKSESSRRQTRLLVTVFNPCPSGGAEFRAPVTATLSFGKSWSLCGHLSAAGSRAH